MNKRHLSKQQQRRIARNQQRTLLQGERGQSHDNCNGRIVSHHGKQLLVEYLDDAESHGREPVLCHQRANLPRLVTGDLVVFDASDDGSGVILALGERNNIFSRPDSRGNAKPVAANLDTVLVVFAAVPEPFMNLIDRYLVAIEALGLNATLVLNKADLLAPLEREKTDSIVSLYTSLDYPVFTVSAGTGMGMDALEGAMSGKTAVLVGQSGVGKSSLINRLAGKDLASVGQMSTARGKGTHTTTTATLFHLRQFDVIDSPGIREFPVSHLEGEHVISGFRELRDLPGRCKFRNCSHTEEPGCAIREALANHSINPLRWQSYQQIMASLGDQSVK